MMQIILFGLAVNGASAFGNVTPARKLSDSGSCTATLYAGWDFGGWSATFGLGEYTGSSFLSAGAVDNEASSLRVIGDANCYAIAYGGTAFTGWEAVFGVGSYSGQGRYSGAGAVPGGASAWFERGGRMDEVSSIKVELRMPPSAPSPSSPPSLADGAVIELTGTAPKIQFGELNSQVCELKLDSSNHRLESTCEIVTASNGRRLAGTEALATAVNRSEYELLREEVSELRRLLSDLTKTKNIMAKLALHTDTPALAV